MKQTHLPRVLYKGSLASAVALVMTFACAAFAEPAQDRASPAPAQPVMDASSAASARVHIVADYQDAVIETRSSLDRGAWSPACALPCNRTLRVEDVQLRVVAPEMTPSNVFRVEPGSGTARLRVSGGSAAARRFGIIGLAGGIPLALGGGALFGYAQVHDRDAMRTAGIVTLAAGALAVVAALPLLVVGSTKVRDARGSTIAQRQPVRYSF